MNREDLPPVISLGAPLQLVVECGGVYNEPGATAMDDCDGDISGQIQVSGEVDTGLLGDHLLTYSVTDSFGNPAAPAVRTVTVADTTPPVTALIGGASVTSCGGTAPSAPTARQYYGAPLEPVDGIWLGAGQEKREFFEDFVTAMDDGVGNVYAPALYMHYMMPPVRDDLLNHDLGCVLANNLIATLTDLESGLPNGEFYIPQIAMPFHGRLAGLEGDCGTNEADMLSITGLDGSPTGTLKLSLLGVESDSIAINDAVMPRTSTRRWRHCLRPCAGPQRRTSGR